MTVQAYWAFYEIRPKVTHQSRIMLLNSILNIQRQYIQILFCPQIYVLTVIYLKILSV